MTKLDPVEPTSICAMPLRMLFWISGENSKFAIPSEISQLLTRLPFCSCPGVVRRGLAATLKRTEGPPLDLVLPSFRTASKRSWLYLTSVSNVFETCFSRLYVPAICGVSIVHGVARARQPVPGAGTAKFADWKIVPLLSSVAPVKKSL